MAVLILFSDIIDQQKLVISFVRKKWLILFLPRGVMYQVAQ